MTTTTTRPLIDGQLELDGRRYHYLTAGAGSPMLVLHGIMGVAHEWDTLSTEMARDHRVVALDQRGHGESDWADTYTADAMADDAIAVIERLDLAPVRLIGHSMGGMAGMLVAARRPVLVERLVLVDIAPDSLREELSAGLVEWLQMLHHSSYSTVAEAAAVWAEGNALARLSLLRHYARHNLVPGPDGRLRWRFDTARVGTFVTEGVTSAELWTAVDSIQAPTLLVRGAHSWAVQPEDARVLLWRLADGTYAEVADGGHDLGVEQPEAVAAAVRSFLAG
ncbi:MAG TPA: alpha/beta hydrolase [Acidimicrobiia bacterium]|nr:alpha/beta hydrolase [Acidimicrobiia bacterium]